MSHFKFFYFENTCSLVSVICVCVFFFLVWLIKCLSHFGVNIKGWHLTLFSNDAAAAAAAAKSLQLCLTLCNPVDSSSPGSPVPGILQARILEWVAISFSNAWKRKVKVKSTSRVWLFVTPWTTAYQAPPSMGFSRQEYWSGMPLPSLNHLIKERKAFYVALHYILYSCACVSCSVMSDSLWSYGL